MKDRQNYLQKYADKKSTEPTQKEISTAAFNCKYKINDIGVSREVFWFSC